MNTQVVPDKITRVTKQYKNQSTSRSEGIINISTFWKHLARYWMTLNIPRIGFVRVCQSPDESLEPSYSRGISARLFPWPPNQTIATHDTVQFIPELYTCINIVLHVK
jgi:hypothetical protein